MLRDESNLMQRYDMVVLFGDLFIVWLELFSVVLVLCGKINRDVKLWVRSLITSIVIGFHHGEKKQKSRTHLKGAGFCFRVVIVLNKLLR